MRWFGYGCFLFSDDNVKVVFDPHDGKSLGLFPPNTDADIVLCTHNTYARNSFRNIRGNHKDYNMFTGPCEERGFRFEGFPSVSSYDSSMNTIYRFEMDGVSIVICGCIGEIPSEDVIARIGGAHIMIVPIGEYSTMPIDRIEELIRITSPRIVVPSEFKVGGITLPLSFLQAFTGNRSPEDIVYVGDEVEFDAEDIEGYSGVWIFDF